MKLGKFILNYSSQLFLKRSNLMELILSHNKRLFISSNRRFASTFKAAILKEYNAPLQIQELKRKSLKDKEVRVAVHSCAVNISDLLIVENKYIHQKSPPFIPGFEVCGEVLEVGSGINDLTSGQRVIGLNKLNLEGFAEECILSHEDVWPVDLAVSFERGASLAENYATALLGVNRRANIDSSSTILIMAAAGGLGLSAVDLAANVYKAKVVGVCGTDDKADLVRQKGAWAALKYNRKHLKKKIDEVTDGKGVNIVFDAHGGETIMDSLECIRDEGKLILAGFASQSVPHLEMNKLLPKSVSVIGISLTSYKSFNYNVYRQAVYDVIDLHEMGLINPHVSASFKLEETNEAFEYIRQRKSTGKVILEIR